jgi:hypothetical protein
MKNNFLIKIVLPVILILGNTFMLSVQEDNVQSDFVKAWLEAIPEPENS